MKDANNIADPMNLVPMVVRLTRKRNALTTIITKMILRAKEEVESGKHATCKGGGRRFRMLLRCASMAEEDTRTWLSKFVEEDIISVYSVT
mmetsp:Transcript_16964/g.35195  ORF Transcript_16964/g.35195 Transcript_16964/m.35195 type:complete len:91 (-) Transcript_16964:638-910(-)